MLVTFSVVDTFSVFVFNRKLTFTKDGLTLNEFLISKNVSFNTIVEIKVWSSMKSLCSVELSCINDILISDQCIPGTCVFYNCWEKSFFLHLWGILRKIFTMQAGDYERIINYDWPNNGWIDVKMDGKKWKWKNNILRCCDWGSLLNWIGVLTLSLLLKLPPRKLEL